MKHIPSRTKLIFFSISILLTLLSSSCVDSLEGTFYISDDAAKFKIDTTITSFKMVDNNGITEEFYQSSKDMIISFDSYGYHHYFSDWNWKKNPAIGEVYIINYESILNNYSFNYILRASGIYTLLEVMWNDKDKVSYYFEDKSMSSTLKPKVSFIDTLTVQKVLYQDVIMIDYSDIYYRIDDNTPIKTYIASKYGLIKFVRKDDVFFERIQ